MMTDIIPDIRATNKHGQLIVADGFVANFFIPSSHREIAYNVVEVLKMYRELVGDAALRWYVDPEGDFVALTNDAYQRILDELRDIQTWEHYRIELEDSTQDVSGFRFCYLGHNLHAQIFTKWPDIVSVLSCWFPTEYGRTIGTKSIRDFVIAVANQLPIGFGYGSLAFNYATGTGERDAFSAIKRLCFRYPGIDVHEVACTTMDIGWRARGAYWVTVLGTELLLRLGGKDIVLERLHEMGVGTQQLGDDKIVITLGDFPKPGDTNRRMFLPEYRELAKILEDVTHIEQVAFSGFSPDDQERWARRFLN